MLNSEVSAGDHEIIIRNIELEDIEDVIEVAALAFGSPDMTYKRKHYESHLKHFPEGQICVEYNGKIVGSCSSLIINFDEYKEQHTMDEISDNGFIRNHDPSGKHLYGIDVVVSANLI